MFPSLPSASSPVSFTTELVAPFPLGIVLFLVAAVALLVAVETELVLETRFDLVVVETEFDLVAMEIETEFALVANGDAF